MQRATLNKIDQLILTDITENPGTNKEKVAIRLSLIYSSHAYIIRCINRLERRGYIINRGNGARTSLFCTASAGALQDCGTV